MKLLAECKLVGWMEHKVQTEGICEKKFFKKIKKGEKKKKKKIFYASPSTLKFRFLSIRSQSTQRHHDLSLIERCKTTNSVMKLLAECELVGWREQKCKHKRCNYFRAQKRCCLSYLQNYKSVLQTTTTTTTHKCFRREKGSKHRW